MTVEQVRKEAQDIGLLFERSDSSLPWQHVVVFRTPLPQITSLGRLLGENASVNLANASSAGQSHRHVQLIADDFNRLSDTGLPASAQPVDVGSPDHARARAIGKCAEYILPRTNATIENDFRLSLNGVNDATQL